MASLGSKVFIAAIIWNIEVWTLTFDPRLDLVTPGEGREGRGKFGTIGVPNSASKAYELHNPTSSLGESGQGSLSYGLRSELCTLAPRSKYLSITYT